MPSCTRRHPLAPAPFAVVRVVGAALALCLVLGVASGCARGRIHRLDPNPPPRLTEGEPEVFATTPDRPWREIAVVMTTTREGMDDEVLAKHVREIKKAARRAGADAVINARLVTVKKTGYVRDPNTPFPSATQGEWAEYQMKGSAVVYVETDAAGQPMAPIGEIVASSADAPRPTREMFTEGAARREAAANGDGQADAPASSSEAEVAEGASSDQM
jgi:hypothetical protein